MPQPTLIASHAGKLPLEDGSVHVIVTSPPYYGLRDYGDRKWTGGDPNCRHSPARQDVEGKSTLTGGKKATGHQKETFTGDTCPKCGAVSEIPLGREAHPDCLGWATGVKCERCYICRMVKVFREARRVLRDDGTLWIVEGDSYVREGGSDTKASETADVGSSKKTLLQNPKRRQRVPEGFKVKDLMVIPWRLGLALQADGWYLRRVIIWHKTNAMPESVFDRPTAAHEYILLLAKQKRYHYDHAAVKTPLKAVSLKRIAQPGLQEQRGGWKSEAYEENHPGRKQRDRRPADVLRATAFLDGANLRDVWTIPTTPFDGPHFATFPVEIPRRAILAGTSEAGVCPQCGKPWRRVLHKRTGKPVRRNETPLVPYNFPQRADSVGKDVLTQPTQDFRPSCSCNAGDPVPATVLDPFVGSGTTLLAARELGRNGIGCDLSETYLALARKRLDLDKLAAWERGRQAAASDVEDLPLFATP